MRTLLPTLLSAFLVSAYACSGGRSGIDDGAERDAEADARVDAGGTDTCSNEPGVCDCIATCRRSADCPSPSLQSCLCQPGPCYCHYCSNPE
ncbi:MAG: hypothetical protein HYY06_00590 [Deltaproteobacteria bacterium]|nr:hypothetical protein [Deltaproteobacteria bacterium]